MLCFCAARAFGAVAMMTAETAERRSTTQQLEQYLGATCASTDLPARILYFTEHVLKKQRQADVAGCAGLAPRDPQR